MATQTIPKKFQKIKVWIVTYDLPSFKTVQRERQRFYRSVRKWLQEHENSRTVWMTMSTVITQSQEFAEFLMEEIRNLNLAQARASMYEAHLIDIIGVPQQFRPNTPEQVEFMTSIQLPE